jgi:hypothetical protein|nr:MAG TPA: hypothetical protein [Caudoviricetes sp.]
MNYELFDLSRCSHAEHVLRTFGIAVRNSALLASLPSVIAAFPYVLSTAKFQS